MVAEAEQIAVRYPGRSLSPADATRVAERVLRGFQPRFVYLCLDDVRETSTAALAQLVLIRRELLHRGGDLRLAGLKGQAAAIHDLCRLSRALPLVSPEEEQQLLLAAGVGGTWVEP